MNVAVRSRSAREACPTLKTQRNGRCRVWSHSARSWICRALRSAICWPQLVRYSEAGDPADVRSTSGGCRLRSRRRRDRGAFRLVASRHHSQWERRTWRVDSVHGRVPSGQHHHEGTAPKRRLAPSSGVGWRSCPSTPTVGIVGERAYARASRGSQCTGCRRASTTAETTSGTTMMVVSTAAITARSVSARAHRFGGDYRMLACGRAIALADRRSFRP